jgi:hypothetical protein
LKVIADAIQDEDVLDNICHWYDLNLSTEIVTEPYQFYKIELLNKRAPTRVETEPDSHSPVKNPAPYAKNLPTVQQDSAESAAVAVKG